MTETRSGHGARRSLGSRRGTLSVAAAVLSAVTFCIVSVPRASASGSRSGQALVVLLHDHVARSAPSIHRSSDGDRRLPATAHRRPDRPSSARSCERQTRPDLAGSPASRASQLKHRLDHEPPARHPRGPPGACRSTSTRDWSPCMTGAGSPTASQRSSARRRRRRRRAGSSSKRGSRSVRRPPARPSRWPPVPGRTSFRSSTAALVRSPSTGWTIFRGPWGRRPRTAASDSMRATSAGWRAHRARRAAADPPVADASGRISGVGDGARPRPGRRAAAWAGRPARPAAVQRRGPAGGSASASRVRREDTPSLR